MKQKKELKKIYDIIPPSIKKGLVIIEKVEKKISIWTKAFYLFLKTSKYGFVFLIFGIAILGGTLIVGFSPKTEKIDIYPTQYEGYWQNMEMALGRNLSEKSDILEFNHSNSASVVDHKKEIYGEFLNDDAIISSPEEKTEKEKTEEIREKDSAQNMELGEEDKIDLPAQEDSTQDMEPAEEPADPEPLPVSNVPSPEPSESSNEEFSFLKRTKNIFFIPEARANEIDDDKSQEIVQTETEEISNDKTSEQNEDVAIEEVQDDQIPEETVQVGDTEPTKEDEETETEEKFEDYSGTIIIPDIDGNSLFENRDDKKKEEVQTIFTEELSTVYSGFSVPEKKGELKKIKVGFSFASLEKENEDDKIIILWSLNEQDWNTASEFVLNKNYSNKNNSGYFYADLFDLSDPDNDTILKWEDVEDIKIKFSYLTNNNEEDYVSFFLDAVWIETESEKFNEEIEEEKMIEVLSHKKDFRINEDLEFKFNYKKEKKGLLSSVGEKFGIIDYWKDINLTAEIIGPDEEIFEIPSEELGNFSEIFTLNKGGEILMKLKKNKKFRPGLYKIILKVEENGNTKMLEQDFTWGVLAINVNKSIYLPGEEAYLQMGVLKDDGHTVCDANLELRIWNLEFGIETLLSTEDGTIQYSGECHGNNVTDVPDYFAYYTTGETGVYEMKLTNFDNGYEIIDSFEVRDSVPFEIERMGPTRIYPLADYEMVLKIKANEDFTGFVQEKIPVSFKIMNQELRIKNQETGKFEIYDGQFITQDENDNIKLLRWHDLNLKQNDELEIKYAFDAPNVSPDLHLLGPLGFYE